MRPALSRASPGAAAVLVGLALAQAAAAQEAELSAGRRVAATQCGGCHAVDRAGQSPDPRAPRFRDLGAAYPFDELRQALARGMIVGHPRMPVIALTEVERDELTRYLKSLAAPAGDAGAPRRRGI